MLYPMSAFVIASNNAPRVIKMTFLAPFQVPINVAYKINITNKLRLQ